jgi:hypothetical protein
LIFDQGTLVVYAAVSVALIVVFGVLLLISLLNITGRIRLPRRVMDALLVATTLSIAAGVVAVLLAVLL